MVNTDTTPLFIRQATLSDLDACHRVESAGFPPDEAAPRESIEIRLREYPQGFLVGEVDGQVVGIVNSGATDKDDITDVEFKRLVGHDPDGANIVVFSLCVHPDWQGRGYAGALMRAFIERSRELGKRRVLLLCKAHLVAMYEHLGFTDAGVSSSTYGGAVWHEMRLLIS